MTISFSESKGNLDFTEKEKDSCHQLSEKTDIMTAFRAYLCTERNMILFLAIEKLKIEFTFQKQNENLEQNK